MQKKGFLIVYSGPSGVGKGTVLKKIIDDESLNLQYSISMTTRAKRPQETEGINYFFVNEETFKEAIKNDELLEYASFVGNYYGTPKKMVDDLLSKGKNVVLEIEVQGALQVIEKCPDVLSIFLIPPSLEELERRIRGRNTEEEEVVLKRLAKAEKEMQELGNYKYIVCNDDVDKAADTIKTIIKRTIEDYSK